MEVALEDEPVKPNLDVGSDEGVLKEVGVRRFWKVLL
jgi:hypothetical protein